MTCVHDFMILHDSEMKVDTKNNAGSALGANLLGISGRKKN
jgi:hypothetical protein